jgi:hypothetical protein
VAYSPNNTKSLTADSLFKPPKNAVLILLNTYHNPKIPALSTINLDKYRTG